MDNLEEVHTLGYQIKAVNLMPPLLTAQALHTEIKGKKEKVEDMQKNADTCAASIKVCSQFMCTDFFILRYVLPG